MPTVHWNRIRMTRARQALGLASLLAFGVLGAQEAVEAPLAVDAEPAHHLVLTTANARIFRVEVAPHAATQLHQHDNDYLWVALGDADITNAVRGKPEVRLQVRDGAPRFTKGGFAHAARNEGSKPFRNVTIDLLHPQAGARNLCGEVLAGEPENCRSGAGSAAGQRKPATTVPQFETDQTHLTLLSIAPRARFTIKASKNPPLIVALEGTEAEALVEVKIPGGAVGKGRRPLRGGDAMEVPVRMQVELQNTGGATARFLLLEFTGK